jgi:hypothetical protein
MHKGEDDDDNNNDSSDDDHEKEDDYNDGIVHIVHKVSK